MLQCVYTKNKMAVLFPNAGHSKFSIYFNHNLHQEIYKNIDIIYLINSKLIYLLRCLFVFVSVKLMTFPEDGNEFFVIILLQIIINT